MSRGYLGKSGSRPKGNRPAGMMPDCCLPALEVINEHPGEFADWLEDPSNVDIVEFAAAMGKRR